MLRGSSPTVREGLNFVEDIYEETRKQAAKEIRARSPIFRQTSPGGRGCWAGCIQFSFEGDRPDANAHTNPDAITSAVTNALAHHQRHDAQRGKSDRDRVDGQAGRHGSARR